MSKKMTPREKPGYKVGDRFTVINKSYMLNVGDLAILQSDDGSSCPFFTNEKVKEGYPNGVACFLSDLKPISKLKPAKQALADAIHQNGGWGGGFYSAISRYGCIVFWHERPSRSGDSEWHGGGCVHFKEINTNKLMRNWHQCILSRDEYFTAYPDKVNVEVKNETEHKVEAEMKSESEMAIKVSDWHKNGELPPIGEVCECKKYYEEGYRDVVISGIGSHLGVSVAFYEKEKGGGVFTCSSAEYFRPLRTERDKAIEEMMEHCTFMGSRYFAGLLFDAGYRKEVE